MNKGQETPMQNALISTTLHSNSKGFQTSQLRTLRIPISKSALGNYGAQQQPLRVSQTGHKLKRAGLKAN